MENKKCTACGCKDLEEISLSGPAGSNSFFSLNRLHNATVVSYACKKCGHIELYYKKDEPKKKGTGYF